MRDRLSLRVRLERKHATLPHYLVVPGRLLTPWRLNATTLVRVAIGGFEVGLRSLKRLDAAQWFIELTEAHCQKLGLRTGDRVELSVARVRSPLPPTMRSALKNNTEAAAYWKTLTPAQRRAMLLHIDAARQPETRRRRAAQCVSALAAALVRAASKRRAISSSA
jgi:hypothetical protein